jgi:hypothetical protein
MTIRKPSVLPDITDDDFRRKLNPLAQAIVPGSATSAAPIPIAESRPEIAVTGEGRGVGFSGVPNTRQTNQPDIRETGTSSALAERIAAVTHLEEIREARGPKKGVEFLLPARIVAALKVAAAQDGTSMTVKVLEALRAAGYPVADTDFVDLRKLPKR